MKKKSLLICVMILFAFFNVISAQNYTLPKFYEVTKTFFKTDKSYDIQSYMNISLGLDGVTQYKKGDAKVTIKGNAVTIKYGDGSSSTAKIVGDIQDCIVYTSGGDVKMSMYRLDDKTAIRAIQYENGEITLHSYVYNYNMEKYIHLFSYNLYKD